MSSPYGFDMHLLETVTCHHLPSLVSVPAVLVYAPDGVGISKTALVTRLHHRTLFYLLYALKPTRRSP